MTGVSICRRRLLLAGGAAAAVPFAFAQGGKPTAKAITVAQLFDVSPSQQDVSKDFVIGSRAAWQDLDARGGVRGRPVQHTTIEVDGTLPGVRAAIASLRDNASCVVLSGTAGDLTASLVVQELRSQRLGIAHAAPWLQNSSLEVDDATFPIFAARQEQIAHALRSLTVMSVQEVGVVYASEIEHAAYQQDLARTAAELRLKVQHYRGGNDLVRAGQQLGPSSPALLLFVGGTPELAQFTQGLEKQARQRYIVALADVNLQTMLQMGAARTTPVIATQAVPLVNAPLPVVRQYRDVLSRLFDEPPSPHSLAGFIAARYTAEVLAETDVALTRQNVLAQFQKRQAVDVGGYRIAYDARRRGGTFVTQSMLTADGRVIG